VPEPLARVLILVLAVHLGLGLVFAVPFLARGAGSIDPDAREASLGFRLCVLPGVCALWPLLLARWLRGPRRASTPHEARAEEPRP